MNVQILASSDDLYSMIYRTPVFIAHVDSGDGAGIFYARFQGEDCTEEAVKNYLMQHYNDKHVVLLQYKTVEDSRLVKWLDYREVCWKIAHREWWPTPEWTQKWRFSDYNRKNKLHDLA